MNNLYSISREDLKNYVYYSVRDCMYFCDQIFIPLWTSLATPPYCEFSYEFFWSKTVPEIRVLHFFPGDRVLFMLNKYHSILPMLLDFSLPPEFVKRTDSFFVSAKF